MTLAQQHHAHCEPVERDDPRNALLDVMAQQIIDQVEAAARQDVLAPLLKRIESMVPELGKALLAIEHAQNPIGVIFKPPGDAFERGPEGCFPLSGPGVVTTIGQVDQLAAAAVLTALKLSDNFRMSREHRELFDRARTIVCGWIDTVRPSRRVACDPPRSIPATAGMGPWELDAGSGA